MYTLGPAPTSTLRTIPFTIPTSAWTESNGIYTATFASVYITESSKEMCTFDESLRNRAKRDINISKTSGGGSITLTTSALPTGAISGTIFTIDADDGKICMVIEDTVLPIANGGTGANTLAEAKENLGISAIEEQVEGLISKDWNLLLDQANAGQGASYKYPFTIPTDAKELLVMVIIKQSGNRVCIANGIIPVGVLSTEETLPYDLMLGGGIVPGYSGTYVDVYIYSNPTKININNGVWVGTEYSSTATLKVYAR